MYILIIVNLFYTLCYEIPCMTDFTTRVWSFWPLYTRAAAALHHTYTQGPCQFVKWNKGYLKVRISAVFQVQTLFQTFITWSPQFLVQIGDLKDILTREINHEQILEFIEFWVQKSSSKVGCLWSGIHFSFEGSRLNVSNNLLKWITFLVLLTVSTVSI